MVNAMHIGSFDRNVGDNLALMHVQHTLPEVLESDVRFHLIDMSTYFTKYQNNIRHTIDVFKSGIMRHNVTVVVIGGGGLIQPVYPSKTQSGWRLPFTPAITKELSHVPIIVYGVGLNHFRDSGLPNYGRVARAHMRDLILNSMVFSVRNDGSLGILLDLFPGDTHVREKVFEIADPGMIFPRQYCDLEITQNTGKFYYPGFQIAWNSESGLESKVNEGRLPRGPGELSAYIKARAFTVIPHCPKKDYVFINSTTGHLATSVTSFSFNKKINFSKHNILLRELYR